MLIVKDSSSAPSKHETGSIKCCFCCKMKSAIKFMLLLEFLLSVLLIILALSLYQERRGWCWFLILGIISSLSFIFGIINQYTNTYVCSQIFVVLFSIASVQWLTFIIYLFSCFLYLKSNDLSSWIWSSLTTFYGIFRIYFNANIFKQHHHSFASKQVDKNVSIKSQMIAITLLELLYLCIIFMTGVYIKQHPTNTLKDIIYSQACYWLSFITFISFISGVLATTKKFNQKKSIVAIFLIMYFIGTVQWFNFTIITPTIFEPRDVFPGAEEPIVTPYSQSLESNTQHQISTPPDSPPVNLDYIEHVHTEGSTYDSESDTEEQAFTSLDSPALLHPPGISIPVLQLEGIQPAHDDDIPVAARHLLSEKLMKDTDVNGELDYHPSAEKVFNALLVILGITYGFTRCYFTTKIYYHFVSLQ